MKTRRPANLIARGEPMVWLSGGCVVLAALMILGLLAFILCNGFGAFWPGELTQVKLTNGKIILGEPQRTESFVPENAQAPVSRTLYKTGNYDIAGDDYVWVRHDEIQEASNPNFALVIERAAWGNAYGILEGAVISGETLTDPKKAWEQFNAVHPKVKAVSQQIKDIEKNQIGVISDEQNRLRLHLRKVELEYGKDSLEYQQADADVAAKTAKLQGEFEKLAEKLKELRTLSESARLIVKTPEGTLIPANRAYPDDPMTLAQIVRAYPANQLSTSGKWRIYLSRWWEYLADEPREANSEGGVFPAIFGTVLLTFIMILFAVPIGVITAIYLREYARQGWLLSLVRICVNNLAGVPSIVYGVFGLGFFCYLIGGGIDQIFYPERLPDPTVGKSALIWASLTLAILTLPVVIVATEEALAAVPRSMREGSYACGASKWQTIRRIVLPRAMPGIMTGMILAIARGAGEVAPIMLVGAVKLAPKLPISASPSDWFGLSRSFMHLGFHIYDLGFQSRNAEAAKSMVYTTTFLLIAIVVLLNLLAMGIRYKLRRSHSSGQF